MVAIGYGVYNGTSWIAFLEESIENALQEEHDRLAKYQLIVANDLPPTEIYGEKSGDVLLLGWGCTYGAIHSATTRLQETGKKVSQVHLICFGFLT